MRERRRVNGHVVACGVVMVAIVSCVVLGAGSPAHGSFPGTNGKIAFTGQPVAGNPEIVTIEADGSDPVVLTNDPADDVQPAWSPDGTRLAFVSDRDGANRVYVMDADGTNVQRLTFWGGAQTPSWSPDGTRIAYVSQHTGLTQVYVMNADGTGAKALTADADFKLAPQWSPDGTKIAFQRNVTPGNPDVWVMDADGTDQVDVAPGPDADFEANWAPDGTRLAYTHSVQGHVDVRTMRPDGTDKTLVVDDAQEPVWSPDGTLLLFLRVSPAPDLVGDLYLVDPDGSNVRRLTDADGGHNWPSWQALAALPTTTTTTTTSTTSTTSTSNGSTTGAATAIPVTAAPAFTG